MAAMLPSTEKSSATIIEIRDLHTRFGAAWVHRGIDLTVARGDMLALVGGSGSGKTTLLRQMVGLLQPASGEIRLFGEPLSHGDIELDRALRRRFGMLFQQGALFSSFTVFDNVAFPLRELKCFDEALIHDLVMLKLAMVELLPRHAWLMPAELSGGMVKRVALARALALEPELLLLDEPTAGLDPDRSDGFVRLIRMLGSELGLTVVLVTHDLETMAGLATRIAVLADHRILACDDIDQIMQIDHPFIETFFRSERGRRVLGDSRR
jgi:phospholipid/cholesterol/gamma-HCH transport system ATP-binding protein